MTAMRRRVWIIFLLLLGGAIVNVAVAWGCGAPLFWKPWFWTNGGPLPSEEGFFHLDEWEWHFSSTERPGVQTTHVRPLRTKFMMKTEETSSPIMMVIPIWRANKSLNQMYRVQTGWPLRSLQYAYGYRGDWDKVHKLTMRGAWQFGVRKEPGTISTPGQFAALPWIPLWPGFAINTIFYAAILWVVWFVPGLVRRRIRRRRGLCPACAYPIGTSPVCTECGTALA